MAISTRPWLNEVRARAEDAYRAAPEPDRVAHLWRYTDPALFRVSDAALDAAAGSVARGPAAPAGVRVTPLALAAEESPALIRERLGAAVGADFGRLEALNLARWRDGFLVHVSAGKAVAEPLRLPLAAGGAAFTASRVLVVLEPGASLTLVEELAGGHESAQVNVVTEAFLGAGASLQHVTIQELAAGATLHLTHRAVLGEGAKADSLMVSLGGAVVKADTGALLSGLRAESVSRGIIAGSGRQHFDHHTVHDHRADATRSDFDFKTVLADRSRSVYTGAIRIDRTAAGCEAYQENRNLMLSAAAKADSIPELEIMNNEVRCTHGATMGPIEPEHVFYLASRGIPSRDATRLIVEGFVETTIVRSPAALRDEVRDRVVRRLELS